MKIIDGKVALNNKNIRFLNLKRAGVLYDAYRNKDTATTHREEIHTGIVSLIRITVPVTGVLDI